MLTREENELVTRTGRGTPMGELFRRFWLPVALAEELPGPDCDPVRQRVLGEDLILFRDTSGRPGLVDAYCPHRGAPMFFGRNEENGLRCVYHGWKFDVEGTCVDLPNAPEGETFKQKVRIDAYPCVENHGLIWAYLGPKDKQPPFPQLPWVDQPRGHVYVKKFTLFCNYLQAMESAPLTQQVQVQDEFGATRSIIIPAERALTVFVDKRELVTLMTLGAAPELLVLGYLRNQRLVDAVADIESITVDWDVQAAAVRTRHGIEQFEHKTAKRVVTTGCGQGTMFGDLMAEVNGLRLPPATEPTARLSQSALYGLLGAVRVQESTYKSAGSVHGCALFCQDELLTFVEDVGRHNAIDTIAGWMWLHGVLGGDKIFYTTGRLTSEMVLKSAQMGVPIVVSRSGVTQMGYELATRLGLALFGRATNRHFIGYCGLERFDAQPEPARPNAGPTQSPTHS